MQYQMNIFVRFITTFVILFFIQSTYSQNDIQSADIPDPARFTQEIQQFINWDNKNTFPTDAMLFVGSSSIRLWETNRFFHDYPVINRGFGGSHISDVNYFFDSVVRKYHPQAIIFYAGDNDIAAGKEIAQVVKDYKDFINMVEEKCSGTPVVFIAIKPSLARWNFWPRMQETNQKITEFSLQKTNLHVLDISMVMLDQCGEPDPSLFIEDGLHITESGYELWTSLLKDKLSHIIPIVKVEMDKAPEQRKCEDYEDNTERIRFAFSGDRV